jgi:hypothetical protein
MRPIAFICLLGLLAGCATPNTYPRATSVVYDEIQQGIKNGRFYSRHEIYALLGEPYSVYSPGDIDHCQTAVWKIPHGTHGWGHLKIEFNGNLAVHFDTTMVIALVYKVVKFDDFPKMQPFDATVNEVVIERHFFSKPDVSFNLIRSDNGQPLAVEIDGATQLELQLADSIHQGTNYIFPKVVTDFMDAHNVHQISDK